MLILDILEGDHVNSIDSHHIKYHISALVEFEDQNSNTVLNVVHY